MESVLSGAECLKRVWSYFFRDGFRIKKVLLLYSREEYSDYEDVTYEYKTEGPKGVLRGMSKGVIDYVFDVSYTYNGQPYVLLSRDPDHVFPPQKPKPSFRLPIKDVLLLDENDVPVLNVTEDFKRYEGPYLDFHGESVRLKDMCDVGHKIRFSNVMGKVVDYIISTGIVSHQTIWSPSKI